jgi:hypothetical protein
MDPDLSPDQKFFASKDPDPNSWIISDPDSYPDPIQILFPIDKYKAAKMYRFIKN